MAGEPLIVNVALTGMVPTRESSPHVPLTTEEILDDVRECSELGDRPLATPAQVRERLGLAPVASGSLSQG